MRTAKLTDTTVALDMLDALELSELLDYLARWLRASSEAVRAELARYAVNPATARELPRTLTDFSMLLVFGEDESDDPDLDQLSADERMQRRW